VRAETGPKPTRRKPNRGLKIPRLKNLRKGQKRPQNLWRPEKVPNLGGSQTEPNRFKVNENRGDRTELGISRAIRLSLPEIS